MIGVEIHRQPMKHSISFFLSALLLAGCVSSESESETRLPGRNVLEAAALKEAQAGKVDFVSHMKPILEAKCVMCHNKSAQPGRMSLASQADALETGALGGFIVPGNPDKSRFITHVKGAHASVKAMPPVGEVLTTEETAIIRRWISQGAQWPGGAAGRLAVE